MILVGHLTVDPVGKMIGEKALSQFAVATNRRSKRKDGTVLEEACFLDVEAWNRDAELAVKYLKRGDPVLIEGRIRQAKWQAKDGTERSKHILVVEQFSFIDNRTQGDTKDRGVKTYGTGTHGTGTVPTEIPKTVDPKPAGPMADNVKQVMQRTAYFNKGSVNSNLVNTSEPTDEIEVLDDLPF